jgi:hypothetical protein
MARHADDDYADVKVMLGRWPAGMPPLVAYCRLPSNVAANSIQLSKHSTLTWWLTPPV